MVSADIEMANLRMRCSERVFSDIKSTLNITLHVRFKNSKYNFRPNV